MKVIEDKSRNRKIYYKAVCEACDSVLKVESREYTTTSEDDWNHMDYPNVPSIKYHYFIEECPCCKNKHQEIRILYIIK